MTPEEFRHHGHLAIDWIAEFLEHVERYPVLPPVKPGELTDALPRHGPERGEPMEEIVADFERLIVPASTQWNHPGFLAYFANSSTPEGILGELYTAALNGNGMLWKTSPAVTELEQVTLRWLRQWSGLPEDWFGLIYDTASTSSMHAIAAAREAADPESRTKGTARGLVVYTSEQSHSSIEKGAIAVGIGQDNVRKVAVDAEFRMRPEALEEMIERDLAAGLRPCCVTATVGTTSTTSVDPVPAIAGTGSMLVVDVVPTVATTQNGRKPAARSASTAAASASGRMRNSASVPILRTFRCPMPIAIAPFSIEECASSEQYNVSPCEAPSVRASGSANSRAAAMACMLLVDAVSNMMPNVPSGSPIHCRSQSSTTCSSSVAAGDVFHNMALAFSDADSNSAIMPGPGAVFAKYAMNPGWFQCVMAGTIRLSKSSSRRSIGSPCSGPRRGRASTSSPGSIFDSTG